MDPINTNPSWASNWMNSSSMFGPSTGNVDLGVAPLSGMSPSGAMGSPALSPGVFGSGMNGMQFASAALGGLQTLGNLWMGLKSLNLAKKQFNFSKDFANTNLANQTKVYNTNLTDRENSRAVMEGLSPQQAQSYISSNSLATKTLGG